MSDESAKAANKAPSNQPEPEAKAQASSEEEPAAVVLRVVGPVGVAAFDNGDLVIDRLGASVPAADAANIISAAARSGVIVTEVSE